MFSDAIANSGGGGGGFFSSLGNLFGGSGGSSGWSSMIPSLLSAYGASALTPKAPSTYQPQYQSQADQAAYGDISGLNNPYSSLQPYEFQQMLAQLNNPNISPYMNAARKAGSAYTAAGNQAGQGAGLLMKNANSLYENAYDPQSALYNKLQQQNTDQSNVLASMYGMGSSPYGAGLADQSNQNFNINWQNQQLQRELSANQAIGQDVTGAQGLMTGGAQDYLTSGSLPYSTYNSILGDSTGALNQYMTQAGAGNNMTQQAISDYLQYMGLGPSAAGTNLAAYDAQLGANANTAAGLYPIFSNMFSGSGNTNPFSTGGGGNSSLYGGGYSYPPV